MKTRSKRAMIAARAMRLRSPKRLRRLGSHLKALGRHGVVDFPGCSGLPRAGPLEAKGQMKGFGTMLTTVGIHPAVAVVVVAVDSMLFGGTVATGGIGWAASVPVGIVLGAAAALIQRRGSPQDDLWLAAGKGLVVALLTAIPTPLPAVLVAGAGTAGAVTMFRQRHERKRLGTGESDAVAELPRVAERDE